MKNSLKYWVSWLLPALLCAVWILAAEAGGRRAMRSPHPDSCYWWYMIF